MTKAPSYVLGAVAYFLFASLAVGLTRLNGGVALLWVANAVPLVMLCGRPVRQWPAPLLATGLGGMTATMLFGPVPAAAPAFAVANIGEAALAAALLRRWGVNSDLFRNSRSVLIFAFASALVAPSASAFVGATVGVLAFGKQWDATWVDWFVGHGVGALIAAPLILLVSSGELFSSVRKLRRRDAASALLLLGLVAAVTTVSFWQSGLPLLFLPMLPAMIATFSLRVPGAVLSVVLVAAIGGLFTIHGYGPVMMIHDSHILQLQFFQLFLATTFLMCLPVAGALNEREQLLTELQAGRARFRLLADNVTDAILEIGSDGIIRYASPAVRDLAGFDPAMLVGRPAVEFMHADDRARAQAAHREALAEPGRPVTIEYRVHKADGEIGWFETRARAIVNAAGEVDAAVSAIRDIGERKALESRLRAAADTDPLTGLANRRAFLRQLDRTLADGGAGLPASIALLDLDHFKKVNDSYGHAAGDTTLMLIADVCRKSLRGDDMVARIGGEEFALLLAGVSESEAAGVCERMRHEVARCAIPIDAGRTIHITASIGVAELTVARTGPEALSIADAALYRAKAEGRDRVALSA